MECQTSPGSSDMNSKLSFTLTASYVLFGEGGKKSFDDTDLYTKDVLVQTLGLNHPLLKRTRLPMLLPQNTNETPQRLQ